MATSMIKYDDGTNIPNDCFPVRPLRRLGEEGEGAWLVAHRAEQRRRFKAIICARPKTYNTIKEERRKAELIEKGNFDEAILQAGGEAEDVTLDGFFLLRHCKVEDPADLCTMKINGLGLSEAREEDFPLFENVVRINAAENMLPLEAFNGFPALQELEVPMCGLRNITLKPGDFPNLEYLDVSYNELSVDDIFAIGLIPKLKRLHASGNNLRRLPEDMAVPHIERNGNTKEVFPRFNELEILMLDDNRLGTADVFASLAGLRTLKILNLSRNEVRSIPHLRSVAGKVVSVAASPSPASGRGSKKGRRSRPSSSRQERPASQPSGQTSELAGEAPGDQVGGQTSETVGEQIGTGEGELSSGKTSELAGKIEHINAKMLEINRPDSAPIVCVESAIPSARSIEEIINERPEDKEEDGKEQKRLPAPFHTLRSINLSYNKIESEENLLAVAAWPVLSELIIHDNPLTTRRSGTPPLLQTFLADRFGINIIRKKPNFKPRPVLAPDIRHKVNLHIPPVPRCDVDKLLAIGPPPLDDPNLKSSEPLPPIQSSRPEEEAADDKDSFFVTQLQQEYAARPSDAVAGHPVRIEEEVPESPEVPQEFPVDLNDFSPLFEDGDDPDVMKTLPTGLPGTIEALEFMLSHPLTEVERRKRMDHPQPAMRHLKKKSPAPMRPRVDPAVQTQKTLEFMREQKSTLEAPLDEILKVDQKKRHMKSHSANVQRNEAEKLLSDIQRKYNVVRSRSMKIAKQESKQNIGNMIEEIRDQIRRNLEDNQEIEES